MKNSLFCVGKSLVLELGRIDLIEFGFCSYVITDKGDSFCKIRILLFCGLNEIMFIKSF